MSISVGGTSDKIVKQVLEALRPYEEQHPSAQIEAYRQNSVSIRVRIIDDDFSGISRTDRHEHIWTFLEKLPEEVLSEMSLLVLLTPAEAKNSFASYEFDHPTPSDL